MRTEPMLKRLFRRGGHGSIEITDEGVTRIRFDNDKMIEAMGCTGEAEFVCWRGLADAS